MIKTAYSDSEKKQQIYELQNYRRTISFYNTLIPRLIPDGSYGTETSAAVKAFQNQYGLPPTGETDSATWDAVYREYQTAAEFIGTPEGILPFANGTVLSAGDHGTTVYMLQVMLDLMGQVYDNLDRTDITGVYDIPLENAVKRMQSVWGYTPDGKVNIFLWNRIVRLFNAHAPSMDGSYKQ